ncbi:toll-like receptor Tollo [Octopus bimaculoides]|nr:toll-like receptor Tollo [Octopus bimaculoides]
MKLVYIYYVFVVFSIRQGQLLIGATTQNCPAICKCTQKPTVAWCREIPTNMTNFTSTLTELHLTNINLGPTLSQNFPPMPKLELLDLSKNGIYLLGSKILHHLPNLKTLILKENMVSTLAPSFFEQNTKLEYLDLSKNKFSALPDHCMKYLRKLKVFNISYNILTSPSLMLGFQQTKNLQVIDYSQNKFHYFAPDTFLFSDQWNRGIGRHINLSYCNIKNIYPKVFENFPDLVSLSLSGNPLILRENLTLLLANIQNSSSLKKLDLSFLNYPTITSAFADLQQITIKELDLSGNKIDSIEAISLQYLSTLHIFKVNRNKLKTLNGLVRLGNLRYLDISYNQINKLHIDYVKTFFKMEHFIGHHNKLLTVSREELLEWKGLRYLDISHNKLEMLNLPMVSSLETLYVSHNKLRSLLFPVGTMALKTIDASNNKLTSMVPFQFSGMQHIHLVNYSCNDITMIHEQTFKGYTPKKIDLSGNKITKLDHYGWEFATEVYLRNNPLKKISIQAFYHMFSLEILDLGHNKIKEIVPGTFKHLKNLTTLLLSDNDFGSNTDFGRVFNPLLQLKHLDLSANALTVLNNASLKKNPNLKSIYLTFNNLTKISPAMFSAIAKLERIDFSLNPYVCDCSLLPLRDWLRKTSAELHNVHVKRAYACNNPPSRKGINIWDFEVENFECHKNLLYLIIFGSFTIFVVVSITILAIARYIHEKCKQRRIAKNFKMLNRYTIDWVQSRDQINPLLTENLKKKSPSVCKEEQPKLKDKLPQENPTEAEQVKKENGKENIYVNCQELQQMRQNMQSKINRRAMTPDPYSGTKYNSNVHNHRRHSFAGNNGENYERSWQYGRRAHGIPDDRSLTQWRNQNQNRSSASMYHIYPDFGYSTLPTRYPTYVDSWPNRYSKKISDSVLVHRPYQGYQYLQQYPYYLPQYNRHLARSHLRRNVPMRRSATAQWL